MNFLVTNSPLRLEKSLCGLGEDHRAVVRRASNRYACCVRLRPFANRTVQSIGFVAAARTARGPHFRPFFFLLPLEIVLGAEISTLDLSPLSVGGNVFYYCHFWAPTYKRAFLSFLSI